MQAFADSLLVIPKTLAVNAGLDVQDTIVALQVGQILAPSILNHPSRSDDLKILNDVPCCLFMNDNRKKLLRDIWLDWISTPASH